MPKILANMDEVIFKFAKELFYEKGYEQVSMRDISKRSGIAVGTYTTTIPIKKSCIFQCWRRVGKIHLKN